MRRTKVVVAVMIAVLGLAAGCGAIIGGAGFEYAVEAFDRGDYKRAVATLEDSLRRGRDSARARTLLGWSYYKLDDLGRAREEFERSLRLDPRDANAFYAHEGLGWVAYKRGDYDRAVTAFAEALRLEPGYANAHTGLGWTYLVKGDFVRAEANFNAALRRAPADVDARRGLGFVAYRRGDWTAAIERLRPVLRDNEADTLTRSALAWAYYYRGDYGQARPLVEELARREPTWADPLLAFGWIAERQGRGAEAKAHFRAAIERSAPYVASGVVGDNLRTLLAGRPEWLDLWRDLGWGLYQQRAFPQAEAEFTALLQRHPADPDGLRGLGYTLYALKKYPQAIVPLERAVASRAALPPVRERVEIPQVPGLHEISSDAVSTLGWSYYYAGDLASALRAFREATAAHPDWPDPWSGLGWVLVKHGDRAGAEAAFRRSVGAQPGYADAVNGLRTLGLRTP